MRIVHSSLLLGCLLAAAASAHAQSTKVYQWRDDKGVTHFTDTPPPPNAASTTRNVANPGGAGTPAAEQPKITENPQCTNAKYNQQLLASNAPVQETGNDGKPHALSGEDRANRKQLADAAVANFCKPPEPPADSGDDSSSN